MRRLIVSPRARRQLDRALTWWVKNRDKAPEAFDEDVEETFELIVHHAGIGQPVRARKGMIRRVLMPRVRYYVYYRLTERDELVVLAVWHASRRPPRL
jgi:plasmid stabilization system protein ParE